MKKLFVFVVAFASLNAGALTLTTDLQCSGVQVVSGGLGQNNNVSVIVQRAFPGGALLLSVDNNGSLLLDKVAVKVVTANSYANGAPVGFRAENGDGLSINRAQFSHESDDYYLRVNGNTIQDLRLDCKEY